MVWIFRRKSTAIITVTVSMANIMAMVSVMAMVMAMGRHTMVVRGEKDRRIDECDFGEDK